MMTVIGAAVGIGSVSGTGIEIGIGIMIGTGVKIGVAKGRGIETGIGTGIGNESGIVIEKGNGTGSGRGNESVTAHGSGLQAAVGGTIPTHLVLAVAALHMQQAFLCLVSCLHPLWPPLLEAWHRSPWHLQLYPVVRGRWYEPSLVGVLMGPI
jgi:hypothetical protein